MCKATQDGQVMVQSSDKTWSIGEGMGWWWPAKGLEAWTVALHAWDLLKEYLHGIIFITSTIVWPQVNNREGTQLHPSIENWIKVLLSMALPIRTRPSFPLSQSLPSRSFYKPLMNSNFLGISELKWTGNG